MRSFCSDRPRWARAMYDEATRSLEACWRIHGSIRTAIIVVWRSTMPVASPCCRVISRRREGSWKKGRRPGEPAEQPVGNSMQPSCWVASWLRRATLR